MRFDLWERWGRGRADFFEIMKCWQNKKQLFYAQIFQLAGKH